jgi:hypothetical protein
VTITLDQTIKLIIAKYGAWVLCLAAIGYFILQSPQMGGNDFSNSYFGAKFLLKGEFDLDIFDPYSFNRKIYNEGYRNLFLSYNPNPPSTSIFFVPFALLPLDVSKVFFNIVTSALFLFSTYRLCKHLKVDERAILLCIPIIFFIPIRNQILFGQTYFLIFALMVEGFIAHQKNKVLLASALWSIAIFIKVFPAIVVLFLIIKKDWKQLLYLGGSCTVILVASIVLQGIEVWEEYLLVVLPRNNRGEIHSSYLTTYQSALMLFKYLFVREETLNPKPFIDSLILFKTSLILFKTVVLAICTVIIIHRKDILSYGLVILCGILISPYGSTYSNILLLILLIALSRENSRVNFWVSAFLIFLIGNIPISLFEQLPVVLRFPRLILMCVLFIFIFSVSKAKINARISLFYLVLFGIPLIIQPNNSNDSSRRLLSRDTHNLIFDYGIRDGLIFYNYWYGEPKIYYTNVAATKLKTNDVYIKNNQVFYRQQQMTHSPDKKINVSILDDHSIIYLSDKGKGIGFYTIRTIPLKDRHEKSTY